MFFPREPNYCRIARLRFVQGQTCSEISVAVGMTPRGVRKVISDYILPDLRVLGIDPERGTSPNDLRDIVGRLCPALEDELTPAA
jgi:hypothetical protein